MASSINASITSSGIVQTADASGILQLQSNGVTGLTVGTGGLLTAANGMVFSSMTLGTATTGEFEYDGRVPYFTPAGTQRGVVPGMQYYRLNSDLVGSNVNTAQSIFGVGVSLSASTVYQFESVIVLAKSAGATNHNIGLGFGGTATINHILTNVHTNIGTAVAQGSTNVFYTYSTVTTNFQITSSIANALVYSHIYIKGSVNINAAGTFIPQYTLSAAPGGAYSTQTGSYFLIYPVGAAGSNTSVGTWA